MCNKNTSTTSTTAPNPQAMAAYSGLLDRAQGVANTPYTPYAGELVAPVNAQQQAGIGNINANANYAQPYIGQAAGYATAAAAPVTAAQIAGFQNPYTQSVVNATQAQFGNANAQQQAQLTGNAAAQGALGGDRVGVAQAILAGQQSQAQAPVIAGLYSQGYNTALSTALAEQQNQANAAYSLGNLGVAGQNAALTGANAQVGAGTLEQTTQQALDAARLQQFYQQQAYPFQTTQWLAGIDTGVGSQMGGTSATTPPAPNPWNTALGLGVAALGAFAKDGGRVRGFALGGAPYAGVAGYVPTAAITHGAGAPKPPTVPGAAGPNFNAYGQAGRGLGNLLDGGGSAGSPLDLTNGFSSGEALGSLQDIGSAPQAGFGLGALYAKGGMVGGAPTGEPIRLPRGYDDGGPVTLAGFGTGSILPFADRFAQAYRAVDDGTFDPQGLNAHGLVNMSAAVVPGIAAAPPAPPPAPGVAADEDAGRLPDVIARGPAAPPAAADLGLGDLPLGYAPTGFGAPAVPGVAAAGAPAAPTSGVGGLNLLGLNFSPAARQGLLAAGFGLMASRSPYLGQAIGEGGLQGLSAYSGEQKQEMAQKKTQADIERGKQQLAQAAKAEADRIAMETRKYTQLTPYEQANLDLARRREQVEASKPVPIGQNMLGQVMYGIRDPRSGAITPLDPKTGAPVGQPVAGAPPAPAVAPAAAPATGDQAAGIPPIGPLPAQAENAAQMIASYRLPPLSGFAMKTPYGQAVMGRVSELNGDYNSTYYNEANQTRIAFAKGQQGDAVRSFSVGISHLDVLNEAVDALKNGDVRKLNALRQYFQTELGLSTAPTTVEAIKPIVAGEITKAIIGARMGEGDRRDIQAGLNRDLATANIKDVIEKYQQLMGGQLLGFRRQYETGTHGAKDFEAKLSPAAVAMLHHAQTAEQARVGQPAAPPGAPPTVPSVVPAQPTQADIDYVRAHPEVRDKFVARFGQEP